VAALLMAEACWLALLGALSGALLALGAVAAVNAADLHMPPPPGAVDPIDLELALVPSAFAGAGLLMLVVLLAAAALPAARAARLRIVDALGHV
jgi:putative ABC transport system permease protein